MFADLLNIYIYSNFEILSIIMKKVENYKRACKSCTPVYAVISKSVVGAADCAVWLYANALSIKSKL